MNGYIALYNGKQIEVYAEYDDSDQPDDYEYYGQDVDF